MMLVTCRTYNFSSRKVHLGTLSHCIVTQEVHWTKLPFRSIWIQPQGPLVTSASRHKWSNSLHSQKFSSWRFVCEGPPSGDVALIVTQPHLSLLERDATLDEQLLPLLHMALLPVGSDHRTGTILSPMRQHATVAKQFLLPAGNHAAIFRSLGIAMQPEFPNIVHNHRCLDHVCCPMKCPAHRSNANISKGTSQICTIILPGVHGMYVQEHKLVSRGHM